MEAQNKPPTAKRPKGRGKDSTRRIAAGMLAQVTRGKTLDEVRDRLDPLAPQERNLADAIVQVSLRHYGEIKIHLAAHMKRALPLRPHIAHALLVTGAAQLLYMNVPPHAAIDETVAATGRQEQPFRGLINAVLRKIAAAKQDGTLPATDAADNLPDWMRARFEAAYGAEGLVAICAQQRLSPALDICFKNPEKAAAWAKERAKNSADKNTDKNNAEKLTETHLRLTAPGAVTKLDGFQDGDWFVQDVAAGWPAAMLLGKLDAPSRVLDLCAAPGGKTLQVAAAGHAVTALDISAARLQRVRENLQRTGLSAELVEADAFDWQPDTEFDAIILDAPCSASGTLRRHPDLALNRNEGYIAKLADMQARLLDRAAKWLTPQGFLVYAVCSLDPEEGEAQAEAFLARHTDFRLTRPNTVPEELLHDDCLRTTPAQWADRGGMDGFFAALFQKTKS
jgi:16S rRNA (cytosine967-C5)-methyltransferase